MSFSDFVKYEHNVYSKNNVGEGYCSNFYLIKDDDNWIYVLDKKHSSNTSKFIKSILREISPMEYYQSLSLEKGCDTMTRLPEILRSGKDLDTFEFAIIHGQEGRYW